MPLEDGQCLSGMRFRVSDVLQSSGKNSTNHVPSGTAKN